IGRNWRPRIQFAGTYNNEWLENHAPFWPDDFDYRYFQTAPPDQQLPYPTGGEEVLLENLTANGHVRFNLPSLTLPVLFIPHRGKDQEVQAVIDTVLIEPDLGTFTLTWRASLAMRRSCFDIAQVIVGEMPKAWHRARRSGGKPYYRSLAEFI